MFRPLCLVAIGLLAAASPARASLINGDFQTGDFTGWTLFTTANGTNGPAPLPRVVSFNTTGGGASLAAQFQVGQVSFTSGVFEGGGLFQSVSLSAGTLNIDADIAVQETSGGGNLEYGRFELLLDGVVVDSHQFGAPGVNVTGRSALSFATNVTAGSHEVRIRMTRPFTVGDVGETPFQYIDNARISGTAVVSATAVPEPMSLVSAAVGAVLLAGRGLRRRLTPVN